MEKAVEEAKTFDMKTCGARIESKSLKETKAIIPDWRGNESLRILSEYPIRPGEKDCFLYLKYGSCGYGVECRFNHPPPQETGQLLDCKFFKVGACKRGSTCPFKHPKGKDVLPMHQGRTSNLRDLQQKRCTSQRASESKQGFEDVSQRRDEKASGFKRPREMAANHNVEAHNQLNPQELRKKEIKRMRMEARIILDQIRPTVLFDERSRPKELMKEFGHENFEGI